MTNGRRWRRRSWPAGAPGGSAASTRGRLRSGRTAIVDRQLEVLRAFAADVFVVGRDDPAWSARGLTSLPDDIPGWGPLGGIYTAIVHSPCDRTLVVACDMPFLSARFSDAWPRSTVPTS